MIQKGSLAKVNSLETLPFIHGRTVGVIRCLDSQDTDDLGRMWSVWDGELGRESALFDSELEEL